MSEGKVFNFKNRFNCVDESCAMYNLIRSGYCKNCLSKLLQEIDKAPITIVRNDSYTESDLVLFGNFLLSTKRDVSNNLVTHAYLENWKESEKKEK